MIRAVASYPHHAARPEITFRVVCDACGESAPGGAHLQPARALDASVAAGFVHLYDAGLIRHYCAGCAATRIPRG